MSDVSISISILVSTPENPKGFSTEREFFRATDFSSGERNWKMTLLPEEERDFQIRPSADLLGRFLA